MFSQHPTDALVRELIDSGRAATDEEVVAIVARMGAAPFESRPSRVPIVLRGQTVDRVRLGRRESALLVHLAQRVLRDAQWSAATTADEYLADLRQAVRDPVARLVVYHDRGGAVAGVLAANAIPPARRGLRALPWLYVVYAADRGTIISGYQVSGLRTIRMPGDEQWLT